MIEDLPHSPLGARIRAVLDRMDDDVVRTLADLGITDYRSVFSAVIRSVAASGPVTIRELADGLGVTHSAASQRVAEMRRRGLVELVPGTDARQRLVHLTAGARKLKPALDAEWDATDAAFATLNAELTASLSQVVGEMNAALHRRSFRERIADAAATLPDLDPVHRAAITGGDRG
ncbi:MAG: MarR family winged helix-turn-helix transcriptional regulator [Jatrophihabitantaceae bacterium]